MSTRSDALDALLDAKTKLDSGLCHRAKEDTMAVIARSVYSDYNALIILASGTCKSEKALDQAGLIGHILQCWKESPSGEASHGEIWSICTSAAIARKFRYCSYE
jgi:hypothetical protein